MAWIHHIVTEDFQMCEYGGELKLAGITVRHEPATDDNPVIFENMTAAGVHTLSFS